MFFTTLLTLAFCAVLFCFSLARKKKSRRLWGLFAALILFLAVLLAVKAPLQRALFFYDTPAQAVRALFPNAKIPGEIQQDGQAVVFYADGDSTGRLCAEQSDRGWQVSRSNILQDYSLSYNKMTIDVNYLTHPDRRCVVVSQTKPFQTEGYQRITSVTDSLGSEFIPFNNADETGFAAFLSQVPDRYTLKIGGDTYEIDLAAESLPALLTRGSLFVTLLMPILFLFLCILVLSLVKRIQKKKRRPLSSLSHSDRQAKKETAVKQFKSFYALFLLCASASAILLLYKLCQGSPEFLLFSDISPLFPLFFLFAILFYLVCLNLLCSLLYFHCAPKTALLYSKWLFPRSKISKMLSVQALLFSDDLEGLENLLDRLHPKSLTIRLLLLNYRSSCCKKRRDREGMLRCREAMQQLTAQRSLTPRQKETLRVTWTHLDSFDAAEAGDWETARTFCDEPDPKQLLLTQVQNHYRLGVADLHTGRLEDARSHFTFAADYGGELPCAREAKDYLDQC